MARALRIQYPGAYYHVTCRGNERREIYKDDEDRKLFKDKLKISLEVYAVEVLSYVLMSNHFHLLISTPQGNLSEFMRHFNISYTSAYNRRHRRSGHLYQGRYKSFLIDADSYLVAVSRYIHLNPIRIKKYYSCSAQEQWAELQKYTDSSLAGLDYMGGDTRKGRQAYKQTIREAITRGVDNPLALGKGCGIVGENEFIEWVKEKILSGKGDTREQPSLQWLRKSLQPKFVIAKFAEITGKRKEELCRRGSRAAERAQLMELLYRHCDITQPEIGQLVGRVDYSAVSQARKRLQEKMAGDKHMKLKYDEITKQLTKLSS
jgi:putative transposase